MEKNRLYYMDKVEHLDNLSYGLCRWITRVFVAQITSVICCLMLFTDALNKPGLCPILPV